MQFALSEEEELIRESARKLAGERLAPLAERLDRGEGRTEFLANLKLLAKNGFMALNIQAGFGGTEAGTVAFALALEELAAACASTAVTTSVTNMVGEVIQAVGTSRQQADHLPKLADGTYPAGAFCLTESGAGSDPAGMKLRARRDGDDYVIDGHKWFTSAADGAAFAIAMVVTNPEAASPHQRASQIIVPTDSPGFRIVRNISIMGDAGDDYLSHSEVIFERCRVPRANLLGEEGRGFALAQVRLGPGRIHHCMRWIGICERALDLMCRRAATRELAPGKLLATRQVIQHWIAEGRAEINAARLLVLDTADKMERSGGHAARVDVSIIKFYVANVLHRLLDRAIQVHGALGITDDTPLAFWYRHERGARIYDGADEVHKTVVAREVLKQYGVDISL